MNGAHDLGGLEGFGPVNPTKEEPAFHADWERGVFGLAFPALMAGINLDEFRHGIEKMAPVDYLSSRYYEHWLYSMELNFVEKGLMSKEDYDTRVSRFRENPDAPLPEAKEAMPAEVLLNFMRTGASSRVDTPAPPRFKEGDAVRVRNEHPHGHTRAARYLRGKRGTVSRHHGSFAFPDASASGTGPDPKHVYTVAFDGREVWGEDSAEPNQIIYFDLWEPYLEET